MHSQIAQNLMKWSLFVYDFHNNNHWQNLSIYFVLYYNLHFLHSFIYTVMNYYFFFIVMKTKHLIISLFIRL